MSKFVLICMLQLHKNSGSARTAFENIRYFKAKGFEVHVASLTMDKALVREQGAIPHKLLPWLKGTGLLRRRWYNWQVQRLRKKLRPTITLGHGDIQEQDVATLHNCVFLASELIHGRALPADHEMAITHGNLLRNQGFKKLIANSELMKADTIQRFGVDPTKIHVVYPALDIRVFFPTPERRQELRRRFNFPDKVVVSLVTSGNFKKRGLDLFIEAIESLPSAVRDAASFRVLGKDEKGEYQRPYLTFDPGLSDIQSYYNAIDVFVLPARIEEFGRVVLEAMGCGLPIITTDKVGASELLEGKAREFVVPAGDSASLREAMRKLIEQEEQRRELGNFNAELARAHSEDSLSMKFDEVFNSLLK